MQFHRARQRGLTGLDVRQQRTGRRGLGGTARGALGLFLGLDALPRALDAGGRDVAVPVGKDMRMPPDHFSANRFNHVAKAERVLLFGHAGVVDDLKQQVAEFIPEVVEIAARNRVGDLIGLFDRVGRDRLEILLEVPRTTGHGRSKLRHDLDQAGNVAGRGHAAPEKEIFRFVCRKTRRLSQWNTARLPDFHDRQALPRQCVDRHAWG